MIIDDYGEVLKNYLLEKESVNFNVKTLLDSSLSVAEKFLYCFPLRQQVDDNYLEYYQLFSQFDMVLEQATKHVQKIYPIIYDFSCFLTFLFQKEILSLLELTIIMKSYPVMIGFILNSFASKLTDEDYMFLYKQMDKKILLDYMVAIYDLEFENIKIPLEIDFKYLKENYFKEKAILTKLS